MARFDWVKDFAEAATAPLPGTAPQLEPLAHTRGELAHQLASASMLPQTPVTRAYIAEAKRRLARL